MFGIESFGSLLEIIGVNVVLSGDNAVVIALAARALPVPSQRKAIVFGTVAAIALRLVLTLTAVELLSLPWLRLVGSVLLLWIGIKMLLDTNVDEQPEVTASGIAAAIRTILIADFVMSLDNVLGVAAAARGNAALLIVGLLISIPLIAFGSTIVLRIMRRFPLLVSVGAGLIGYVAVQMLLDEPVLEPWIPVGETGWAPHVVPLLGAIFVIAVGTPLARIFERRREQVIEIQRTER